MEWDTAAAHAVVNEAGKKVFVLETGEELGYNRQNLKNPWFIACSQEFMESLIHKK